MIRALAAALLGAACGAGDPCDAFDGTCATIRVESEAVDAIDQLELDALYNGIHDTRTTQPDRGGAVELPIVVALGLAVPGDIDLGVVAAGKLSGTVLGTGSARARQIRPGEHAALTITLGAPMPCTVNSYYCGGDMIAGSDDTLYRCNGGGVPLARAVCKGMCVQVQQDDDGCLDIPGPCVVGSNYCGGDKLVGDPHTLYMCLASGKGQTVRECERGCRIVESDDDECNP